MKQVGFTEYQYIVGNAGFVRKIDFETSDRVSVIYVDHVNTTMARANYYASRRAADYWVKKELLDD